MKLFELVPAYQGIMDEMEQAISDPDRMTMLLDTLESVELALDIKVDGYCKMMTMLNDTDGMKAESKRLADRAKAQENAAKALKERLHFAMEVLGKDKIKTELFTVSLQDNPGKVDIHDLDKIPAEFKRTTITVEPDKKAIGDALKSGKEVDGAVLMTSKSLRIR